MKPHGHIIASGVIGILIYTLTRSITYSAVSTIAGIFMDIDHFLDYYLNHSFTLKVRDIYSACLEKRFRKLYVFLHSYELVIALWSVIFLFSLGDVWKAVAIGATQHILLDQVTNPVNLFSYFLSFRLLKGFKKELILRKPY